MHREAAGLGTRGGTGQDAALCGHVGAERAVCNGRRCCWTEPGKRDGGEKVSLPLLFLKAYLGVGKELLYRFLVIQGQERITK